MDLKKPRPYMLGYLEHWRKLELRIKSRISRPTSLEKRLVDSVAVSWSPLAVQSQLMLQKGPLLRILYVAPRYDYGNPGRGLSAEENYFFHTLFSMGHEIIRFDPLEIMRLYGREQMNAMLLEAEYRFNPDIVFSVLFKNELDYETIQEITRRKHAITVNWFCDDQWRFDNFSRFWGPHFDWVVTTAKSAIHKYNTAGIHNVILSQWACNHRLYYPMQLPKLYDVTFVGQPHGNRREIINQLRSAGLNVRVWGHGWKSGRVSQYQMVRIFNQSRINLNLSNASVPMSQQIKGRNFEIPGCGGFLLTNYVENLEEYYNINQEIVCFDQVDDLIDKARYYLTHEAERALIAEAGYRRTLLDHTFDARFIEILRIINLYKVT